MKNLITILSAVLFISATLVSCGGNELESDAKKLETFGHDSGIKNRQREWSS